MIRRALGISVLLVAGAVYLGFASKTEPTPVRRPLSELPTLIGNWQGEPSVDLDQRTLEVLGVDDYTNRLFTGPDKAAVSLYIGYYRSQRQGDTMHSPLNCLPGAGWNPIKRDHLTVSIDYGNLHDGGHDPQPQEIEINDIVILKGLERQVVLYWYQSHGRIVASEYWGKIYTVIDAIRTNRTDAALVRVISPVVGSEDTAERTAEQNAIGFVKGLVPLLSEYLPN